MEVTELTERGSQRWGREKADSDEALDAGLTKPGRQLAHAFKVGALNQQKSSRALGSRKGEVSSFKVLGAESASQKENQKESQKPMMPLLYLTPGE